MRGSAENEIKDLEAEELCQINGGWGGGGSLAHAYGAAAHEMGDFVRGIIDGLSSMWK